MLLVSYLRTWPLGSTEEEMAQDRHWRRGNPGRAFGHGEPGLRAPLRQPHLHPPSRGRIRRQASIHRGGCLAGRHPHLKVNLSVGGWGAEGFSAMALTPENRAAFTADALNWLEGHDLDGIDIDWEYPVGGRKAKTTSSSWLTCARG